jgi:hypothetical protein
MCSIVQRRYSVTFLEYFAGPPLGNLFGALNPTRPNDERGKSIRVLVADSNQTQSQVLSSAIRHQPGIAVTCCGGKLDDCKQVLRSALVDIILLSDSPTPHDQLVDTLRDLHVQSSKCWSYSSARQVRPQPGGECHAEVGREACSVVPAIRSELFAGVFQWSTRVSSGPIPNR